MKKGLAIIIIAVMLLGIIPAVSFGADYEPYKIFVNGMTYTDSLDNNVESLAGGALKISCNIQLIDKKNTSGQSVVFFTVVKKYGKIVSRNIANGFVSGKDEISLSNQVEIPSDTAGIKVESYFWDSIKNAKALAPCASFGSEDTAILALYIDGERFESFDGSNSVTDILLPASYAHIPDIIPVAKDSSANITISKITTIPQNVTMKVKTSGGSSKTYGLKLKLKDGEVTDAYMLDKDKVKKAIGIDKLRKPYYGVDGNGNEITDQSEGFVYGTTMPIEKTLIYNDRVMYYAEYPEFLSDATAVQTALQLFRYDTAYKDKANTDAVMGGFTINRSANIYLYAAGTAAWAKKDGYVSDPDSRVKVYYTGQSTNPYPYTGYKKTVSVPEGGTEFVRIGSALTDGGVALNDCFILVDFISPDEIYGISDVEIDGVSDFSFNPSVTEYEIELNEGIGEIPDISYSVYGLGATAALTGDDSVPGVKTLTVKSSDSSKPEISYVFRFKTFETALNDIKVGGKSITGFDKNILEYTYNLKYGWKASDGLPEVTEEHSSLVSTEITPATTDTMETIIKASSDKGETKYYKVKFVETLERQSEEKTIALGWNTGIIKDNANIYSAFEQNRADVYNYSSQYLCAFNNSVKTTGYTPIMGYMQLDLNKITEELDLNKPVLLRLHSRFTFYDKATNGASFDDGILSIYDMSGFDWENSDLSTRAIATDLSAADGKELIATVTASDVPESTATVRQGIHDVDITDFVKKCINENNLTPTLGFKVTAKPVAAGTRNRVVYWMYKYNSERMSYVVYNKFTD